MWYVMLNHFLYRNIQTKGMNSILHKLSKMERSYLFTFQTKRFGSLTSKLQDWGQKPEVKTLERWKKIEERNPPPHPDWGCQSLIFSLIYSYHYSICLEQNEKDRYVLNTLFIYLFSVGPGPKGLIFNWESNIFKLWKYA